MIQGDLVNNSEASAVHEKRIRDQRKGWNVVAQEIEFYVPFDVDDFAQVIYSKTLILDKHCADGRICRSFADQGSVQAIGYDLCEALIA